MKFSPLPIGLREISSSMIGELALLTNFFSGALMLEARLESPRGYFERFVDSKDERIFQVNLRTPDGELLVLEDHHAHPPSPYRNSLGKIQAFAPAPRFIHKSSSLQIAGVHSPTPLDSIDYFFYPSPTAFKIFGKYNRSWLSCALQWGPICLLAPAWPIKMEANVELSVGVFLQMISTKFKELNLNAHMPLINAYSWASDHNQSFYDRFAGYLYFGGGNYPDGLDGFVVIHEWAHALIDSLNPGLAGFDAALIHEGIADYIASDFFDSPCFAPYDALEVSNRVCVRNILNQNRMPDDLSAADKHYSSLIVSGALWELRDYYSSSKILNLLLEALIRSPKMPNLRTFWNLLDRVHQDLEGQSSTPLFEVGRRRGFIQN